MKEYKRPLIKNDFFPTEIIINKKDIFPMIVMATVSSGKSTLINALLGEQLLPSKNEACTAKKYSILDDDQEKECEAYITYTDGKTVAVKGNMASRLQEMNEDENALEVLIRGNVRGVTNSDRSLLIIDTPGPNNSRDDFHKAVTMDVLDKVSGGMILYIINATQFGINDDKVLLGILMKYYKYSTTTADQSALLISTSDNVTITDATISKTGDSDGGDNCNFYGLNAAVLVKDGSTTTITGATITSDADGANGVFSYGGNGGQNGAAGDGTKVIISDSIITTTGDGSGGIMTTGGGITEASNLTVTTSGRSSAAIRTDRGGGTVTVDGGTYTTNGLGSPAIYSTADITVSNAELVSNLSEGVCIEGINSITLNNCNLTANNTDTNGNATFYDTIMIYQSMSGDADSGTSVFTMNGGTLTSNNGHVFHVTNTSAIINLDNVKIVNKDSENILLSVCDDGWNGDTNKATVNASNQVLEGNILVGSNSEVTLYLTDGSSFTGTFSGNITNAKGTSVSTEIGTVSVTLDKNSTWTLTADTYIASFDGEISNVISNGYTLYVNGIAIN